MFPTVLPLLYQRDPFPVTSASVTISIVFLRFSGLSSATCCEVLDCLCCCRIKQVCVVGQSSDCHWKWECLEGGSHTVFCHKEHVSATKWIASCMAGRTTMNQNNEFFCIIVQLLQLIVRLFKSTWGPDKGVFPLEAWLSYCERQDCNSDIPVKCKQIRVLMVTNDL